MFKSKFFNFFQQDKIKSSNQPIVTQLFGRTNSTNTQFFWLILQCNSLLEERAKDSFTRFVKQK